MTRYIALAAIAVLSACSDSPTAPTTKARPVDGASPIILKPIFLATLSVREADINGNTLMDVTTKVKFSASPTDTFTVLDNSAADADKTVGIVKVTMQKTGTYTACFITSSQYAPDASTGWNPCSTVSSTGSNVDLGTIYAMRRPMLVAQVKNQLGTLIGGATIEFSNPSTGYILAVKDDDANDDWNNVAGYVLHAFDAPGTFGVCETLAPKYTFLTSQQCFKIHVGWNQMIWPVFTNQEKL
jgi:hypothetical protein